MKKIPIPPRDPCSNPNARFVELLEGGLLKLWNGRKGKYSSGDTRFICNTFHTEEGAYKLEKLILVRLDYTVFEDWLRKHGRFTVKQTQEARRAWMLDMIQEFSPRNYIEAGG